MRLKIFAAAAGALSMFFLPLSARAYTVDFGNTVNYSTEFDASDVILGNYSNPSYEGVSVEELSNLISYTPGFGVGAFTFSQPTGTDPFVLDIIFSTPISGNYTISGSSYGQLSSADLYSGGALLSSSTIYGYGYAYNIGGIPGVTDSPGIPLQAGQQYDLKISSALLGGIADVNGAFVLDASAAPEPAAWALMMLGTGGVGVAMRNSKRKPADGFAA